ncbi:hypothetical protein JH06_2640 [Blastocystis sp. subtype 4]|uniref:hypothetical protein n=1 Tax=Blastocystis sp. subtype 4 TaxID=944170 RepID=UPI000711C5BD|nr:hypothetical protein JH06_2640 [Blastocystis sp. subtype 4]KNB46086.1 hypothetical protein JH06_2640 [Blastocystis sp. subtype 4]|eukprot:XP_014529511.1 hypothetical protein JH06_2640 [Blastocystis sp. subtype 4]
MNQIAVGTSSMNRETVLQYLKGTLETLFSMESLAEYPYIVTNMDDNGFIPIRLLLPFFYPSIPTVSIADIINAVKDSEKVVVDANMEMIRPNIKVERKTIILRDIPENTTEEELRSLFTDLGTIESINPSIANNWFVVMDSEKSAQEALKGIQNKPFKETVIHARIKNESVLLAINRQINAIASASIPTMGMQYGAYSGFSGASVFSSANMADASTFEVDQTSLKSRGRKPRGGKANRGRRDRRVPAVKPIPLPQIDNRNSFPPLVYTGNQTIGYQTEFIHYSADEIMTIVRDLKDLSLPSIPEGDYSLVLTENANSDLVTKQRTQSIDRSLEAGMPRSYSVDSVDYTTMLMGDMPEEVKEEARKRRRNRKPKRLDYSKVLGKNSVSGEVKKGQHGNRHEEKKGK